LSAINDTPPSPSPAPPAPPGRPAPSYDAPRFSLNVRPDGAVEVGLRLVIGPDQSAAPRARADQRHDQLRASVEQAVRESAEHAAYREARRRHQEARERRDQLDRQARRAADDLANLIHADPAADLGALSRKESELRGQLAALDRAMPGLVEAEHERARRLHEEARGVATAQRTQVLQEIADAAALGYGLAEAAAGHIAELIVNELLHAMLAGFQWADLIGLGVLKALRVPVPPAPPPVVPPPPPPAPPFFIQTSAPDARGFHPVGWLPSAAAARSGAPAEAPVPTAPPTLQSTDAAVKVDTADGGGK
jgi:hypothetical protein